MNAVLELLAKIVGMSVFVYTAVEYGTGPALLMIVYGLSMVVYVLSENITAWWRNRGER